MAAPTTAQRYAAALLGADAPASVPAPHPALDWARSGAMLLTGASDGPPRLAPGPLAAAARGAVAALAHLSGSDALRRLDGPALLGERAALLGLRRRGTTAPGGSCRLVRASDGWIAVNLARPDDVELLPAWLGCDASGEPWERIRAGLRARRAAELEERARLLGLAVAVAADPPDPAPPWLRVTARGRQASSPRRQPVVVDLSSLWAGPLCTQLLLLAGARVVKVESASRPDGARRGPARFFDLLNAGKQSVELDLTTPDGVRALRGLLERADIVVESSRPRALRQLGIDAEALVTTRPRLTWVSITGYGRAAPGGGWAAFGDDAAVAAGLATATGTKEAPLFCADAVADPLTGLHAAVAALRAWHEGGGCLLDLSLRDVAAHVLCFETMEREGATLFEAPGGWRVASSGAEQPVLTPRSRPAPQPARPLGADTRAVLRDLAVAC